MRGRKPKPVRQSKALKLPAPNDLAAEAKVEWKRLVDLLSKQRVLSELDRSALWVYATSMALYRACQKQIDDDGHLVEGPTGKAEPHPAIRIQRESWERVRPLLAEFGLTPSSRARLKLDRPAGEEELNF